MHIWECENMPTLYYSLSIISKKTLNRKFLNQKVRTRADPTLRAWSQQKKKKIGPDLAKNQQLRQFYYSPNTSGQEYER